VYNELYAAWQREINEASLGALPPDFYVRVSEYLKRINEPNPADQKNVKINLLEHEAKNVKEMLGELLKLRYRKIVKTVTKNRKSPLELLTNEEAKMCVELADFASTYQKFTESLLQGETIQIAQPTATPTQAPITVRLIEPKPEPQQPAQKRLTLRFSKGIPAIMGADLKSYGPFAPEDVASLPAENAKILVKQGFAVLVEVS
jgi:DNA replication initiation complex subunit (GINS family)